MLAVRVSALLTAAVLSGCATSPKSFYADPGKPDATSLCRVLFDQAADEQFRRDVANELGRRGVSEQNCRNKINTQTGVLVAAALIGVTAGAVIACRNGACPTGGGGFVDRDCAGGPGDGPLYVQGPVYVGTYDLYHLDADHDGVGCEASDVAYGA
jgi:hypothetical protein